MIEVEFLTPADGAVVPADRDPIRNTYEFAFEATAVDLEGGPLVPRIEVSRDGEHWSKANLVSSHSGMRAHVPAYPGRWYIRAIAEDSGGLSGEDRIEVVFDAQEADPDAEPAFVPGSGPAGLLLAAAGAGAAWRRPR